MKHKKTIEIKNPRLRKSRNNLRLLWINAVHSISSGHLGGQRDLLALDEMNSFEIDRYKRINREIEKLDELLDRSICKCPVCQRSDQDMVFNPVTKVWFCVSCYELNREYYKYTKDSKFYP